VIWFVPCKHDPARPVVFDCVASIRQHHPDDKIVVIDSASDDRSYLAALEERFGCVTLDVENRNFATVAHGLAFDLFPDEDFYACIFDSLLIHDNLHDLASRDFTAVRHFPSPPTPWGLDERGTPLERWGGRQLEAMGIDCPSAFNGLLGPMWFCSRDVMVALKQVGIFDIRPPTKFELCAMERVAGIVVKHLGFDPTCSLQGPMVDFFARFDNSRVEKVFLDRR
jgi:hypothetical protein